jgi:hypothetical protein
MQPPFDEQIRWLRIRRALAALSIVSVTTSHAVHAQQRAPTPPNDQEVVKKRSTLTNAEIAAAIVAASVAAYLAMGKPCACPYNTDSRGYSCGGRSAHSKPRGFSPYCYPTDVSEKLIAAFRRGITITDKAMEAGIE